MLDKIIRLFYDNLEMQFTINEIAVKTGISYSYVHRQIEDLASKEMLFINKQSNRKYCRPNYTNPEVRTAFADVSGQIAEEFLGSRDKIFFIIQKLLAELPEKTDFNLLSVVLFGSLAKGTDSGKSDIDLFILVPSKDQYDEAVEAECVSIARGFNVSVNPVVSEPKHLLKMLNEKELNVGKEILKNKIILFGAEKFWELVFEVIK